MIKSCQQPITTTTAKPAILLTYKSWCTRIDMTDPSRKLYIPPNDKHFLHMKQCNTAEMDWSPVVFILSEKFFYSLYLGILVAIFDIWQNFVKDH